MNECLALLFWHSGFNHKETQGRRECAAAADCSAVCIIISGTLPVLSESMNGTDCISVDGCHRSLASCVIASCD